MPTAHAQKSIAELQFLNPAPVHCEFLLTPEAQTFVAALCEKFMPTRDMLLAKRIARQKQFDDGALPDFLPETKSIRESEWKVADVPADLLDRRVEITGPAEPKMVINALNSGAKVFMADLEDSLSPTWEKIMEGQKALFDAVREQLVYSSPEGKAYTLNKENLAVLIVRPRGWHLPERHVTWNGEPISGALLDFGLYFFHNAKERLARNTGPYFYIPKLENAEEAKLWADIFAFSEDYLGIAHGTIKATILIEVLTAAFEMHEILHALRDYAVGLNCGRWDYIFSTIKKLHGHAEYMLPERSQVTMNKDFLKAYAELLIQTCHKRGAFAMGGMAAFIPVKNDEAANEKAFAAVRADKEREATYGHDGTWVAHPGLIPVAMEVFNRLMPEKNQRTKLREDISVGQKELLTMHQGTITEAGIRNNISVAIQYTANWLNGLGCVPLFNMMEDAATAEISRSQLWQWVHHNAKTDSDTPITIAWIKALAAEEMQKISDMVGEENFVNTPYIEACEIILELTSNTEFVEFLTLPAYEALH
ncbi:MAG: malate synthase A [Rhodospirillales bacterium 12-54-5]|nr:MAG: malate synthase A [Rhodospirillales bacterium 12-54-5]